MARYVKQTWVNKPDQTTPLSAARLNKLETQFDRAIESVEADINAPASGIGAALRATIGGEAVSAVRGGVVKTRGRLSNWGHSYGFGIGASDDAKRFARIVADHYRLDEVNEAVSGTAFSTDGSGASFGKILQQVTRTGAGAVPSSGVASTNQHGFAAPGGIHSLFYGINDVNNLGNTAALLEPVKQSFRTAVSRLRAGSVFESDSAIFNYSNSGADWTTQTSGTAHSGANYKMTTINGAAYNIAVPADFPGGTLAVGLIALAGDGKGGTHSTNSLGTTRTFNAFSTRTGSATAFVWRLHDVPAGASNIYVTVSGIVDATIVDYVQWEAPNDVSPLVILHKQPYPVDYSAYGSSPVVTDAGVDALNQIITDVATEFGNRCLVVNHDSMNKAAAMFAADKLHPSDLGNKRIADETIAAIDAAGFLIENGLTIRPRYDYGTAAPTGTRTYYSVGSYVENTAPTELGTAGSKYYVNGWKCLVAGRPATWVEDRRLTGN